MRRVSRRASLHWAAACFALALAAAGRAEARAEAEVRYTRTQTFSAALRYLRVDLAYEVTEKDPEAAYLLFTFPAPELQRKTAHGSIEIVQRAHGVRLLFNLPELPSYHEEVLKRGLLEKLRAEYGEPPAEDPPPEKKPDKDPKSPADGDEDGKPPADSSRDRDG